MRISLESRGMLMMIMMMRMVLMIIEAVNKLIHQHLFRFSEFTLSGCFGPDIQTWSDCVNYSWNFVTYKVHEHFEVISCQYHCQAPLSGYLSFLIHFSFQMFFLHIFLYIYLTEKRILFKVYMMNLQNIFIKLL
jgi:hypothetical protein